MNLDLIKMPKLSRDAKVNLAFAGFFTASIIGAPFVGPAFLIGSAATNLLCSQVATSALNYLNRKSETTGVV